MPQSLKAKPAKTGAVESTYESVESVESAPANAVAQVNQASVNQTTQNTPTADYYPNKDNAIKLQPEPPQDFNARDQLVMLQRVITMACFAVTMLNSALPLYGASVGVEGLDVGIIWALGALMTALPRPILGRGIDKYGRKRFLLIGLAMMAVSMVMFAYSRAFTLELGGLVLFRADLTFGKFMLYASKVVQGLGLGTILLSSLTMTADLAKTAGRGTSFGYTEQAQYRGGLLGSLVAIPIIVFYGYLPDGSIQITPEAWTRMFLVFAAVAAASFVVAYRRIHDTQTMAHAESEAEPEEAGRTNPQLYVLMAIIALTSASAYGLNPFVLIYLRNHVTPDIPLIALAYAPAAIVWGTLPARMGRFADRYGRKPVMVVGLIGSAILSLFIPLVTILVPPREGFTALHYFVPWALLLLAFFVAAEAVTYAAATPAEQALASDMMGGKERGRGFGLYTFARSSGEVIGPLVMGALYAVRPSGAFIANSVILILGSLLVWFALRDPAKEGRRAKGKK